MEINYKNDPEKLDDFWSSSPHRSIFTNEKFLNSLESRYDIVTCSEKGRILAAAIVILSDAGEPIKGVCPFTQYQGILLADNSHLEPHSRYAYEFKVVEFFLNALANRYKHCCFCQSWRFSDLRPFQWFNYHEPQKGLFKLDLRYTGILPLERYESFEHYLASIRTVRRQEYHKARKSLEIVTSQDEVILDDLHDKTFQRQGLQRSPREASLVRSITAQALAANFGFLKIALFEGKPIAAILYLADDRTVYYLFGANHPEFRKMNGGTLLVAEMIKDAFALGVSEVDFVGVNSPHRGDFKLSFNAEMKPFFVASFG